jgi:pimeloyl-ACP methyl ester carboxylesterase
VRIAFATLGEGPVLVKTANWLTHLEYDWKSPLWRHLAEDLSRDFKLVRYDQRGNGLSDWQVDDISLSAWVDDLKLVVDTLGLERFPLLGISQGCRIAVAFAAQYPERVTHLVLYGGGARGWKHRPPGARNTRAGLQALIAEGWGRDIPAFRQVFSTLFMPGATPEQMNWFNELQLVSTSPENAARITEVASEIDVSPLLPQIAAPALVMHARRDAMVPFEESRVLAAGIRDARFVELDSDNHLLLGSEPAFARFIEEIRRFLKTT